MRTRHIFILTIYFCITKKKKKKENIHELLIWHIFFLKRRQYSCDRLVCVELHSLSSLKHSFPFRTFCFSKCISFSIQWLFQQKRPAHNTNTILMSNKFHAWAFSKRVNAGFIYVWMCECKCLPCIWFPSAHFNFDWSPSAWLFITIHHQ